jgi:hypothetical protein
MIRNILNFNHENSPSRLMRLAAEAQTNTFEAGIINMTARLEQTWPTGFTTTSTRPETSSYTPEPTQMKNLTHTALTSTERYQSAEELRLARIRENVEREAS